MPRAEVGTPKWVANKMKSKGLQRLRWYCQVCEKQCRDENGFKMHVSSEAHLRQMIVVGENAGRHIADFSGQFQSEFVTLLSRRFGTKRVKANNVYQEYIQDKQHLHMNATRWVTLTEFIKHLGRSGVAHVDETDKGWFIAWIDRSPKALEKQEASLKKEQQIERAEQGASEEEKRRVEGLQREEGEKKVVLSLSAKPAGASLKLNPLRLAANPLKANPLKRPNPLKQASASSSTAERANGKRKEASLTAAEKLILEEQERKRRRMEREAKTG
ncbi:domain of Kin17 curved DNA-binding protein-domain-containing protein [Lactarius deliciosus]|nr:domain of Kin17 curved DNA-binding protein-domain-containing protein [Lactarius deliciosus]